MSELDRDPIVHGLRERISELDRRIVETINERLALVGELKEHKLRKGYDLVDPEREERLLADLQAANRGPLSPEGLGEICGALLELTKREAGIATSPR